MDPHDCPEKTMKEDSTCLEFSGNDWLKNLIAVGSSHR